MYVRHSKTLPHQQAGLCQTTVHVSSGQQLRPWTPKQQHHSWSRNQQGRSSHSPTYIYILYNVYIIYYKYYIIYIYVLYIYYNIYIYIIL